MFNKKTFIIILGIVVTMMLIVGCSEIAPNITLELEKKKPDSLPQQALDNQQATAHIPEHAQAELPFGPSGCYEVDFTEGFSELTVYKELPLGWTATDSNWGAFFGISTYDGHTGTTMEFSSSPYITGTSRIITKCINATNKVNLALSYWNAIIDNSPYYSGNTYTISLQISTDQTNWDNLLTHEYGKSGLLYLGNENIDLSEYDGEIFYLSWIFSGSSSDLGGYYIDDISVIGDDVNF